MVLQYYSKFFLNVSSSFIFPAPPGVSPFPSELFGQLWPAVCISKVVTLTSCLIPGPLKLIDGQSKQWSGMAG